MSADVPAVEFLRLQAADESQPAELLARLGIAYEGEPAPEVAA